VMRQGNSDVTGERRRQEQRETRVSGGLWGYTATRRGMGWAEDRRRQLDDDEWAVGSIELFCFAGGTMPSRETPQWWLFLGDLQGCHSDCRVRWRQRWIGGFVAVIGIDWVGLWGWFDLLGWDGSTRFGCA
jgi:hypothetical protein